MRVPALAPFRIRSFRFQWPADLLASWAFEMEGVILGWFVLVATESVLALAVFGSLQFLGTLISPLFGMAGDRFGNRNLLCLMRATYVVVAMALMVLFLTGLAAPVPVFALAMVIGLVRPSDITLRNLLVGETMPADYLMRAMGVSRTTADSARIVGALSGAALVAALGSGLAYVAVCAVYATSLALTFGVGLKRVRVLGEATAHGAPLQSLKESFAYVWSTPVVRAVMLLAFLVNFAAYPLVGSLLAYVARDIYGLGQTGLGWLIASFATGALLGSIAVSTHGARIRPARTMIACTLAWFTFNLVFSWVEHAQLARRSCSRRGSCKVSAWCRWPSSFCASPNPSSAAASWACACWLSTACRSGCCCRGRWSSMPASPRPVRSTVCWGLASRC